MSTLLYAVHHKIWECSPGLLVIDQRSFKKQGTENVPFSGTITYLRRGFSSTMHLTVKVRKYNSETSCEEKENQIFLRDIVQELVWLNATVKEIEEGIIDRAFYEKPSKKSDLKVVK